MKTIGVIGVIGALALGSAGIGQAQPAAGMWEVGGTWQEFLIGGQPGTPGNVISAEGDYFNFSATLAETTASTNADWDWITVYTNGVLVLENAPDALWANPCLDGPGFTTEFAAVEVKTRSTRYLNDADTANDGYMEFELTAMNEWVTIVATYAGMPTYTPDDTNIVVSGTLTSAAIELGTLIDVDIKGGSAKAPINVRSQGVLPVVVYGTPTLNVRDIKASSLKLACASPLRWSYADLNGDRIPDLNLKYRTQAIVGTFENVRNRAIVTLHMVGQLKDGTPVSGSNQVTVIKNTPPGQEGRTPKAKKKVK